MSNSSHLISTRQDLNTASQSPAIAVTEVIYQYQTVLQRHLAFLGLDSSEIEDACQELYLRLLRRPICENVRRSLKNYLLSMATNLVIDQSRRKKTRHFDKHISIEDEVLICNGALPDETVYMKQCLVTVKTALMEMPKLYSDVFIMSRYLNKEQSETAECLGVSTKTVNRRLKKALEIIRRRLELI